MAFRNNNNKNRINTTTRIIQLYNENAGEDSSTMRLGLWNDYASININPMLPKSERVDGKVYNYEQTASTLLSIDNIFQLQTGIKLLEKDILNAKKGGSRKINSVTVKSNNVLIQVGGPGEYEGIDDYFVSLWSLNDNDEIDGNMFYIFTNPDDGLMINYDTEKGSYKNKNINTQWEEFKTFIDYCANNLLNGGAHGANKNSDFQFSKLGSLLETTKALIENLISGSGSSDSGSSSRSGFNSGSSFGGSRRRRSSVRLSEDDIDDTDFINVEEGMDEEVPFLTEDDEEEEVVSKPKKSSSKKTSGKSKKTSKKSSKKISVDDIASDMESDLDDDMDDLD